MIFFVFLGTVFSTLCILEQGFWYAILSSICIVISHFIYKRELSEKRVIYFTPDEDKNDDDEDNF
jgi:hypothetical protein